MKTFLKLIRLPNLLIIILTQLLTKFSVIDPILNSEGIDSSFESVNIFLLVLMTLLITSAGYIINDFHDKDIDEINKPGSNLFHKFNSTMLVIAFSVFDLAAIVLGFYLAVQTGALIMGWLVFSIVVLLWLYSSRYKRQLIIGNFIVAFLSGFVVVIVWLFEYYKFKSDYGNDIVYADTIISINSVIFFYGAFAFLISFIREVAKDAEDLEGDSKFNCSTIPIVLGLKRTKLILSALVSALILCLMVLQFDYFNIFKVLSIYFIFAVQIPLLYLVYRIIVSDKKKDFHFISVFLKIIMLTGVLSMNLVNK